MKECGQSRDSHLFRASQMGMQRLTLRDSLHLELLNA